MQHYQREYEGKDREEYEEGNRTGDKEKIRQLEFILGEKFMRMKGQAEQGQHRQARGNKHGWKGEGKWESQEYREEGNSKEIWGQVKGQSDSGEWGKRGKEGQRVDGELEGCKGKRGKFRLRTAPPGREVEKEWWEKREMAKESGREEEEEVEWGKTRGGGEDIAELRKQIMDLKKQMEGNKKETY